jgi:2,3-bisphosphoglycerate-independent phosphoglycerate mutase
VPAGLDPGSETAIPVLLGWIPAAPVDRGAIEAAACGIDVPPGQQAWRVDVLGGEAARAGGAATRRAAERLRREAPTHAVHHLRGHRLLLVGAPPLPRAALAPGLRTWGEGIALPRMLDAATVVVAARGAGAGIATLLGAEVVVPAGATGDAATDLAAKLAAAVAALEHGASTVVVHVGGADEAAHARDAAAKVACLERADRELLAPLTDVVGRAAGRLRVCADHGCDPATGGHDAHPVPHVRWQATQPGAATDAEHRLTWHATQTGPGPDAATQAAHRLTERAVAALAVTDLTATVMAAA